MGTNNRERADENMEEEDTRDGRDEKWIGEGLI